MKSLLSVFLILVFAVIGFPSQGLTLTITYTANLYGPSESPPYESPGTGFARVVYNSDFQTLSVQATFSGLLAPTTAAHIHGGTAEPGTGTAGVMTQTPSFAGFPLGVTSGTYDQTFDLTLASTYNPAFITAQGGIVQAEAALLQYLAEGRAYFNIHSSMFPGGEIRGFLVRPSGAIEAVISLMLLQ
jgi:hypothetical protein